ncbi:hypothetical protein WA026_007416 [Henosepilachna vigintioctopunctata]|uniref:Uncharacterized protein n=1 Tax=Henosepilachna vigintioctopunctata TaxID=420089 RepID=A0AAW1UP38_9CUCU
MGDQLKSVGKKCGVKLKLFTKNTFAKCGKLFNSENEHNLECKDCALPLEVVEKKCRFFGRRDQIVFKKSFSRRMLKCLSYKSSRLQSEQYLQQSIQHFSCYENNPKNDQVI